MKRTLLAAAMVAAALAGARAAPPDHAYTTISGEIVACHDRENALAIAEAGRSGGAEAFAAALAALAVPPPDGGEEACLAGTMIGPVNLRSDHEIGTMATPLGPMRMWLVEWWVADSDRWWLVWREIEPADKI